MLFDTEGKREDHNTKHDTANMQVAEVTISTFVRRLRAGRL